uniref:(northern house mosquito) hypothetical protein n=1 Tax=Culex pipiens TaxID=7175 RepID=A0A8D8GJP9_CULPI
MCSVLHVHMHYRSNNIYRNYSGTYHNNGCTIHRTTNNFATHHINSRTRCIYMRHIWPFPQPRTIGLPNVQVLSTDGGHHVPGIYLPLPCRIKLQPNRVPLHSWLYLSKGRDHHNHRGPHNYGGGCGIRV